jgi:quinohemoprotein ethanol dehydrogenase
VTQKEAWRVPFGSGRGGGTLSTAGGLVFQGNSTERAFVAYDARGGRQLWSMPAQASIVAGPISYQLDGEQYIAVAAGGAGAADYYAPNGSRLLVFRLDGKATLPAVAAYTPRPLAPPADPQPTELVSAGQALYSSNCALCHGDGTLARAVFPDLRRSPMLASQAAFDAVVLGGVLQANGMASFAHALQPEDTRALRAYVISQAQTAQRAGAAAPTAPAEAPR